MELRLGWRGVTGIVTILTAFAVVMLFVFQTKADAQLVLSNLEARATAERVEIVKDLALTKQLGDTRNNSVLQALQALQEAIKFLNENQQTIMVELQIRDRPRRMPAKATFDFSEMENPQ